MIPRLSRPAKYSVNGIALTALLLLLAVGNSWANDSLSSRHTLNGIKAVYVLVEELQPNVKKMAGRLRAGRDHLQADVESRLKQAGIKVLTRNEWIATTGRPMLYVNVNTHLREKYAWAYDIRLDLQQMASLEINPATKALVSTWSTNITGMMNLGNLNVLNEEVKVLTDIFIKAYLSANHR